MRRIFQIVFMLCQVEKLCENNKNRWKIPDDDSNVGINFRIAEENVAVLCPAHPENKCSLDEVRLLLEPDTDFMTRNKEQPKDCRFKGFEVRGEELIATNVARIKFCDRELSGLLKYDGSLCVLGTTSNGSWYITCSARSDDAKNPEKPVERWRRATRPHKYVEMLVVIAHDYYNVTKTREKAIEKAADVVFFADFYYAVIPDLNLHLVLKDVILWDSEAKDAVADANDIYEALELFLRWQENNSEQLQRNLTYDNAVLMTIRDFNNSLTLGVAHTNDSLCFVERSGSVVRDTQEGIVKVASTLAHELAHNFGLEHNPTNKTDPCYCNKTNGCVMDTGIKKNLTNLMFHPCQIRKLFEALDSGKFKCLNNKPELEENFVRCGDHLVNSEEEQCDCGREETCRDPCCHASSCTLKQGARCSSMDVCCSPETCLPFTPEHLCRSSTGDCDKSEFCDGINGKCPVDTFTDNYTQCKIDEIAGRCYLGECLSADKQCKDLFNSNFSSAADIWYRNRFGNETGNCGKFENGTFKKCDEEDEKCGKLQCLNRPYFTINSKEQKVMRYLNDDHDYSYVKDGTSCGDERFCLNRKCVPRNHLTTTPTSETPPTQTSTTSAPTTTREADKTSDGSHAMMSILIAFVVILVVLCIVYLSKKIRERYMAHESEDQRAYSLYWNTRQRNAINSWS